MTHAAVPHRMGALRLSLLVIAFASPHLLLASDPLVGRWDAAKNPRQGCEFFDDGTVIFNEEMPVSGTWKRLADKRLKVDLVVLGTNVARLFTVALTGDTLVLTDSDDRIYRYVRHGAKPAATSPNIEGEAVHIVRKGCPGEGGCDFKIWTAKLSINIWERPDEHAKVVAALAKGARVKGVEAQTITTHLPLCTIQKDVRADEQTTLHRGDTFLILMYLGEGAVLIRRGDREMQIYAGDNNDNFTCKGKLDAITWVKVKLANGRSGWSVRDAFNGTSQYD